MSRLEEIFLNTGHIYVSQKGYISIEVYSADQMICDYVARMIGGSVHPHMQIRKVVIHSRPMLAIAAKKLLEVVYNNELKEKLKLILEYATADNKPERDANIKLLRKVLNKGEDNVSNFKLKK